MNSKINEKREKTQKIRAELKKISDKVRPLREKGEIRTINEGLVRKYAEKGFEDLRTYSEWKAEGRTVRRGENALYLWSKKVSFVTDENGEQVEKFYFPFLAVFSKKQTVKIERGDA